MFTQPQTVWRSPDMQKPDSYIISMYCSPRINARAFAPARGRWPHRLSWEAPLRTEWGSFGGQKTPKNLCILEIAVFYVFPSSLLYHSISSIRRLLFGEAKNFGLALRETWFPSRPVDDGDPVEGLGCSADIQQVLWQRGLNAEEPSKTDGWDNHL